MFYSQEIISEVKAQNDIVDVVGIYVKLTPRSGNHFGICPFHNEKTPSFSVNRDKQIFYCFGCGVGGNVVSFIKKIENMDFPEALKLLAERVHYKLPDKGASPEEAKRAKQRETERETALKLNKMAARFFYDYLHGDSEEAAAAMEYLRKRGAEPALIKRFGLGLAPDKWDGLLKNFPDIKPADFLTAGLAKKNDKGHIYDRFRGRLMFPIIDTRSRVIGFGGRIMKDDENAAKYLNTPETALFHKRDCLYGLNLAKQSRTNELIIVEGYMDVLAMHQHGFTNTAGVLGTAFKDSHTLLFGERILQRTSYNTVTLILDSDEAGIRAALNAIPALVKQGIAAKILEIPDAKDPDEYLTRFGAAKFAQLIQNAKTHIAFQLDIKKAGFNLASPDGKITYTQEAAKILAPLKSEIETDTYVQIIAKDTEVSPAAIYAEIAKIRGTQAKTPESFLRPRTYIQRTHAEEAGLKDAKRVLLQLAFIYPLVTNALKTSQLLTPEEIGGDIYGELLTLALSQPAPITPSDIFDHFDNDETHRAIAEIFAEVKEYETLADIEKALNQMAQKIKLAYLKEKIASEIQKNDKNKANSLILLKNSVLKQYITLNDG